MTLIVVSWQCMSATRRKKRTTLDAVERVSFRIPPNVYKRLFASAQEENRTVSNYILNVLVKHLDQKPQDEEDQ